MNLYSGKIVILSLISIIVGVILLSCVVLLAHIHFASYLRSTTVINAAETHNWEEVKKEILKGGNANERDERDHTPLMYACRDQNLNMIRFLMKYGANPYLKDNIGCDSFTWIGNGEKRREVTNLLNDNKSSSLPR